jgi:hypothetical protein
MGALLAQPQQGMSKPLATFGDRPSSMLAVQSHRILWRQHLERTIGVQVISCKLQV